ncbi:MAG: hypothetical protein MI867_06935, partial [Pseudomonadales bacterium]|nr:hypothetical protein [Pseudomonadales bacterium]
MSARQLLAPWLELRTIFRETLKRFVNRAWLLSGIEMRCTEPVSLFFSGGLPNCHYIRNLVFSPDCEITDLGQRLLLQSTLRKHRRDGPTDLAIVEATGKPPPMTGIPAHALSTPSWVYMHVDVNETVEQLDSIRPIQSDIRRVRSNELGFEISRDVQELREFHDEMYLPYTLSRHGDRALPRSFERMLGNWEKRALLKIKSPEQGWIGGQV